MQADSLVLGAGIVGVSIAVHLAQRGRSVVLVDRKPPGEETSFGNAGLIQREGVMPYAFPRDLGKLLAYSRNQSTDMHFHWSALPAIAPFLARYFHASRPENYKKIVARYAPLIAQSVSEHAALIAAAGADSLIEKNGWYRLFRTNEARDKAFADAEWVQRDFGVLNSPLSGTEMAAREPNLQVALSGALHWQDPWTIKDPNKLVLAYIELFKRLGGTFVAGDATELSADGAGWKVATASGPVSAREAVIALGPWAPDVTRKLGYNLPLGVKRGYHMHYANVPEKALSNWVLDSEPGYLLAPMLAGIRMTTGAEFALRDAPKTPVQVDRCEPIARTLFPLGDRLDAEPWMGSRPATPDMLPVIGPAPKHKNLWFAFGHAHHGMTLGPATGRLIGEMVTGDKPFIDVAAFSPTRF